jgi:molecular chaperone Hsp33
MLVLAGLLAAAIKYDGVFTVQTSSDGAIGTMIADITSEGVLRAYAGFDPAAVEGQDRPLLGKGYLALTADLQSSDERYQGIVELGNASLTESLQHYFKQSEQVRTGLLAFAGRVAGDWRGGGLLLQCLPDEVDPRGAALRRDDEDAWRRAMVLQASCRKAEILDPDLGAEGLLYRLFHEEGVRIFKPRPLSAGCRCSRAQLEKILASLPAEEIAEMKAEGEASVTCHFCSRHYHFDLADLERLSPP